jgi:long-chain acyl-CoA synthetase
MHYFAKDNQGEVWIRGNHVFSGYHKQPEKTAETLDGDGWLHTGDVGEWTARGTLRIIDRKKNILKLAQGEYVSPEKIENVYTQLPLIAQIYVHGDSLKAQLVAIVVPDPALLAKLLKVENPDVSLCELCGMPNANKVVSEAMAKIAKSKGLHSFEQVKSMFLSSEPFTVENDLLTPTLKAKRQPLQALYGKQIDTLYSKMDDATIHK